MTNEELVGLLSNEINVQKLIVNYIGNSVAKCKDEDFKKKIHYLLTYLDCGAYEENVRLGFRIFARELEKNIEL